MPPAEKVEVAICSGCKAPIFRGQTAGMSFTADMAPMDAMAETTAFIAGRQTFEMNAPNNPAGLRVRYREAKNIGTPVPEGHCVLGAHPCKSDARKPPPLPTAEHVRTYNVNSVTGQPLDTLPMWPQGYDMLEPPFSLGRVVDDDGPPLPDPNCEKCGTPVFSGTGVMLHVPGEEPWGLHNKIFCQSPALVTRDDSMLNDVRLCAHDLRTGDLSMRPVTDIFAIDTYSDGDIE